MTLDSLADCCLGSACRRCKVIFEAVETLLPELAVFIEPAGGLAKGLGFQFAGTPLGFAAAGDEAGAFEHAEVLGDGGHAQSRTARLIFVTDVSPRARRARIARRVGSARAANVELIESSMLYKTSRLYN